MLQELPGKTGKMDFLLGRPTGAEDRVQPAGKAVFGIWSEAALRSRRGLSRPPPGARQGPAGDRLGDFVRGPAGILSTTITGISRLRPYAREGGANHGFF